MFGVLLFVGYFGFILIFNVWMLKEAVPGPAFKGKQIGVFFSVCSIVVVICVFAIAGGLLFGQLELL